MGSPLLLTFDVFGTVLDWRSGLARDCAAFGRALHDGDFDRVIDRQAELESGPHASYAEITRRSLVDVLGMDDARPASVLRSAAGRCTRIRRARFDR